VVKLSGNPLPDNAQVSEKGAIVFVHSGFESPEQAAMTYFYCQQKQFSKTKKGPFLCEIRLPKSV
jgi:hypothetical protein